MGDFITMKFTKNTFLMLGMASIFSITWIGDGMALRTDCTSNPPSGKYCKNAGNQQSCPPGCYCPGGEKRALGTDYDANGFCNGANGDQWPYRDSGIYHCPSYYNSTSGGASSVTSCYNAAHNLWYRADLSCSAGKYLPANSETCADCPSGYVCPGISQRGASASDQGKNQCTGGMTADDAKAKCVITCPAGKYLKKNTETCSNCPDDQYCPGGGPWEKKNSDQGLGTCPEGKVPNDNGTSCEIQVNCAVGTYLPKNSETCAECPDGNTVCKGGKFGVAAIDQGLTECGKAPYPNSVPNASKTDCVACPAGKEPDEDHATCVDAKIHVNAGEYLRANTTTPISCSGLVKKFCPGGSFYKKSVDQGKYDCPFNSNANANNTACELKLTKKQMVNGISGKGECWLKTDPEDYKFCIYGIRFENASNTSTDSGKYVLKNVKK